MDLINRQQALKIKVSDGYNNDNILYVPLRDVIKHLKDLPSAEPEPKIGKWAYKTTDAYIQRICMACGWSERMYHRNRNQDGLIRNYCPNCGVKMKVME